MRGVGQGALRSLKSLALGISTGLLTGSRLSGLRLASGLLNPAGAVGLWEEPPILSSGLDTSNLPSPGDRWKGLQRSHLARLPHLINLGVQSGEQVCRGLGAWGSGGPGEGAAGAAEARTSLQFLKTLFLGGCRLDFMALTADPWIIKQEIFSLGGNITVLQNSCTLVPAAAAHGG